MIMGARPRRLATVVSATRASSCMTARAPVYPAMAFRQFV